MLLFSGHPLSRNASCSFKLQIYVNYRFFIGIIVIYLHFYSQTKATVLKIEKFQIKDSEEHLSMERAKQVHHGTC